MSHLVGVHQVEMIRHKPDNPLRRTVGHPQPTACVLGHLGPDLAVFVKGSAVATSVKCGRGGFADIMQERGKGQSEAGSLQMPHALDGVFEDVASLVEALILDCALGRGHFRQHRSQKAELVHGDLSEFNVLMDDDGEPVVIDVAQGVLLKHPLAEELLERDVNNMARFFRKYGVSIDTGTVLGEIRKR